MKKNRNLVIAAVIVAILILGVATYFLLNLWDNGDNVTNAPVPKPQPNTTSKVDPSKEFNLDQNGDGVSYVQTSTTNVNGNETVTVTEADGKGNVKVTSESYGMKTELYVIGTTSYTCINGACEQKETEKIDQTDFPMPDKKDMTKTYLGKKDCPAGTCDAWEVTSAGTTLTYFLDGKNRISQITQAGEGVSSVIKYDYKKVTVEAPQL